MAAAVPINIDKQTTSLCARHNSGGGTIDVVGIVCVTIHSFNVRLKAKRENRSTHRHRPSCSNDKYYKMATVEFVR